MHHGVGSDLDVMAGQGKKRDRLAARGADPSETRTRDAAFNVFPGLKGEDFSSESLTFQADT
jgi:hypothetical protein